MKHELATRDLEAAKSFIENHNREWLRRKRRRDRDYILLLTLHLALIFGGCFYLEGHFVKHDRINQETASHD